MYPMYKDLHIEKFKRVMRLIKIISMNKRLFWMHLEVHEVVQGAVHVHHNHQVPHVYKDRHIEKFKRVMRHIKLITMNRRLFWMHIEVPEIVQVAVFVYHNHHLPLISARSCFG
jgi:hypothetical protein